VYLQFVRKSRRAVHRVAARLIANNRKTTMEGKMKKSSHLESRRGFLAALASGGLVAPALLTSSFGRAATAPPFEVRLAPKFYPRPNNVPEINLAGKVAVITGASRGIGLAVGLALQAIGVQVIGTSRTPAAYPGHPFPLLNLDLVDPASIQGFAATVLSRPEVQGAGGIDMLLNNAGRGVVGGVVPVDPNWYFAGIQTGLATLYGGHVAVTSALLQAVAARSASGYARILFTTSVQAYIDGSGDLGITFGHGYTASKRALLSYANALRKVLDASGLPIKVSTLNPLWVNTNIAAGTRPIFLQPVDANGNSVGDPNFQLVIDAFRALVANGMPASYAAQAFVQLLTATNPEANVVVGSDVEPYASQGGTSSLITILNEEMRGSAVPWVAGPKQA
jgi:NAD(P)-dependent dehydrogenase (short-subunit alcohol dehydrogenase family)